MEKEVLPLYITLEGDAEKKVGGVGKKKILTFENNFPTVADFSRKKRKKRGREKRGPFFSTSVIPNSQISKKEGKGKTDERQRRWGYENYPCTQ